MVKEVKKAKLLRLRELMLECLRATERDGTVGSVDAVVLRNVCAHLGCPVEMEPFEEQLRHMAEKGYIRTETRSIGDLENILVELTPKGGDLLDGLIKDPTVIAPEAL